MRTARRSANDFEPPVLDQSPPPAHSAPCKHGPHHQAPTLTSTIGDQDSESSTSSRRSPCVRQDELPLWQRLSQSLRERRHPLLCSPVSPVHRSQVLVVHVDPIQPVRLHERSHHVRHARWVCVRCRGCIRCTECGRDDANAGLEVLGLWCRPVHPASGCGLQRWTRTHRGQRGNLVERPSRTRGRCLQRR